MVLAARARSKLSDSATAFSHGTGSIPAARSIGVTPASEAEPGVTVKVTPTRLSARSAVTSKSLPAAGTLRTTASTLRLVEKVAHTSVRRCTV
ncbi:hypothetical protein GCM10028793_51080 [Nocardiopsis oceani]